MPLLLLLNGSLDSARLFALATAVLDHGAFFVQIIGDGFAGNHVLVLQGFGIAAENHLALGGNLLHLFAGAEPVVLRDFHTADADQALDLARLAFLWLVRRLFATFARRTFLVLHGHFISADGDLPLTRFDVPDEDDRVFVFLRNHAVSFDVDRCLILGKGGRGSQKDQQAE